MNNFLLYDTSEAGGIPYSQTEKYEYQKWYTTDGLTDTSEYKTIRFSVRQENLLIHWRYSYLELEGQLVKKSDGSAFTKNTDAISFIFNGIPHLFANGKFTVGNRVVESINEIGYVSGLINYVLLARSKQKCDGLSFMWVGDTDATSNDTNKGFTLRYDYIMNRPATPGKFKLRIPLILLFGFCENFVALRGYPISIDLVRAADHLALFRNAGAEEGKFKFNQITLNTPIVDPSNVVNLKTLRGLTDPKPYLYSFRRRSGLMAPVPNGLTDFQFLITTSTMVERPMMIFIGFQEGLKTDQTQNNALYTHANIETMKILVNNTQFPTNPVSANWDENDPGMFYQMQIHARENYLQFPSTYTEGNILSPINFKDLYPIYVFDVSKQEFTIGAKTVTTKLHATFRKKVPKDVRVHIAWYSERTLELFTNGEAINIKEHTESFISS